MSSSLIRGRFLIAKTLDAQRARRGGHGFAFIANEGSTKSGYLTVPFMFPIASWSWTAFANSASSSSAPCGKTCSRADHGAPIAIHGLSLLHSSGAVILAGSPRRYDSTLGTTRWCFRSSGCRESDFFSAYASAGRSMVGSFASKLSSFVGPGKSTRTPRRTYASKTYPRSIRCAVKYAPLMAITLRMSAA